MCVHVWECGVQPRYGSIVKYQWFGDGYMMIGFSNGYVVVISTHMKEIVEELFSGKFHKVRFSGSSSRTAASAAICGGSSSRTAASAAICGVLR